MLSALACQIPLLPKFVPCSIPATGSAQLRVVAISVDSIAAPSAALTIGLLTFIPGSREKEKETRERTRNGKGDKGNNRKGGKGAKAVQAEDL